jgi:hypothetical protein
MCSELTLYRLSGPAEASVSAQTGTVDTSALPACCCDISICLQFNAVHHLTWSTVRAMSGEITMTISVSFVSSGSAKHKVFPLPVPTSMMTSSPRRIASAISSCHGNGFRRRTAKALSARISILTSPALKIRTLDVDTIVQCKGLEPPFFRPSAPLILPDLVDELLLVELLVACTHTTPAFEKCMYVYISRCSYV